jgi:Amt family ammonium transporter
VLSLAVVSVQWFVCGFSLAFSLSGNAFIGNLNNAFFMGMFDSSDPLFMYPTAPTIPGSVFMFYQGMFAAITPALAFGAAAERTRILPAIFFLFIWSTIVYDVIAYWTWAPEGWMFTLGSLDFAGGTPVHIASGAAGLAYAMVAGKRSGLGKENFKPHNLSSVFLGTALLWFGWFGFNGGSQLAADARAAVAVINTNLSASMGGITWVLWEYYTTKKFSAFAFCSGVVAGLVSITPAAGFVPTWSAVIFGFVGASCCVLFISFKHLYFFDDALDVFGIHGVGGITGNLLTGIFASKSIAALGGATIPGGWLDGHYIQVGYQLAGSLGGLAWSFCVTLILLLVINSIPALKLRVLDDDEVAGIDQSQLGVGAYDYIEAAVSEKGHSKRIPEHEALLNFEKSQNGLQPPDKIAGIASNNSVPTETAIELNALNNVA